MLISLVDTTDPVGYRLTSVAFNAATGDPIAAPDSTTALVDILTNPDMTKCPDNCFRPVGLAWDSASRLWMSSDTTGELYVLQKISGTPTTSASGSIVTTTGTPNQGHALWTWETKVLSYAILALATALVF